MTLRRFLFINPTEGFAEEQDSSAELVLGGLGMSGSILMNSNRISGLESGSSAGDALAFGQTGAQLGDNTVLGTTTLTGSLNANSFDIYNVPTVPAGESSAVNKSYVDSIAQGLDVHNSVVVLASGNIDLSGTGSIDGVESWPGERVLAIGQLTGTQNGIYVVETGSWARAADMTTGFHAAGSFCFIESGSTYADTGWVCTNNTGSDTVGTDALGFTQFSGQGTYTAGNGLKLTGTQFSVNLTSSAGLQFNGAYLEAKVDGMRGVAKDDDGIYVKINTGTLQFDGGGSLNVLAATAAEKVVETFTLSGSISIGDPVYIVADNTVHLADASSDVKSRVIGISTVAQTGSTLSVVEYGLATSVLSGAVAGTPYYLKSGGGLTTSIPVGNVRVMQIGKAVNGTDLLVQIIDYGKKIA